MGKLQDSLKQLIHKHLPEIDATAEDTLLNLMHNVSKRPYDLKKHLKTVDPESADTKLMCLAALLSGAGPHIKHLIPPALQKDKDIRQAIARGAKMQCKMATMSNNRQPTSSNSSQQDPSPDAGTAKSSGDDCQLGSKQFEFSSHDTDQLTNMIGTFLQQSEIGSGPNAQDVPRTILRPTLATGAGNRCSNQEHHR